MDEFNRKKFVTTEDDWPLRDLDSLSVCPVCACRSVTKLYDDLRDFFFGVAPGIWSAYRCLGCSLIYLSPRPSLQSIGRAYDGYFTHDTPAHRDLFSELNFFRRVKRRLANGYSNFRFSTRESPASILGIFFIYLLFPVKFVIDRRFRHIPKLPSCGGRLLDVGAGDGSFVALASSIGWDAIGVDPDADAAAGARSRGVNVVHGGIGMFDGESEIFDVITLSHVLEHVHDPIALLRRCQDLLASGGILWIETPNSDSFSFRNFGKFWRGFEVPRHLCIFNSRSLIGICQNLGFASVSVGARPSGYSGMAKESRNILRSAGLPVGFFRFFSGEFFDWIFVFFNLVFPSRREFITLIIRK